MSLTYSISELAKEFDITTRAIRYYEAEDLLHPLRNGQTRVYSLQDRVHLKLILKGKRLGFSLAEAKELIYLYDPDSPNRKQLTRLMEEIQKRRKALRQQSKDIREMLRGLDEAELRCRESLDNYSDIIE